MDEKMSASLGHLNMKCLCPPPPCPQVSLIAFNLTPAARPPELSHLTHSSQVSNSVKKISEPFCCICKIKGKLQGKVFEGF